jgi:hypothetical protein
MKLRFKLENKGIPRIRRRLAIGRNKRRFETNIILLPEKKLKNTLQESDFSNKK